MPREELYLADLIDNARAVRGYPDGVTRERWDAEDILRDAMLYRMLLLGEIASASGACHPERMPSQAGTGSPAADGPTAPAPSWQHEPAVRAALREHWDLRGELRPLQVGPASRTWQAAGHQTPSLPQGGPANTH